MTPSTPSLLTVRDLRVGYGREVLLPAIDFAVGRGELWAVAGPNGAGKSTLIRTILGLQPSMGGTIALGGRVGYVAQRARVSGRMPGRVIDVVTSGLDTGWSFLRPGYLGLRRAAVERAMEITRTAELRRMQFDTLSEGQKQRVLVARALAAGGELLVLDEPTSAMDIEAEHRVMHLLDDVRARADVGVLLVSHHIAVVAEFATHLVVLDRDLQSAVCGPLSEVGRRAEVTSRYGDMFVDPKRHSASHFAALGHPEACEDFGPESSP